MSDKRKRNLRKQQGIGYIATCTDNPGRNPKSFRSQLLRGAALRDILLAQLVDLDRTHIHRRARTHDLKFKFNGFVRVTQVAAKNHRLVEARAL